MCGDMILMARQEQLMYMSVLFSQKLGDAGNLIETVRGVGYRIGA